MRIKVDDGYGTISTVDGAEEGKSNGVVSAKGDDSREGLPVFRGPELLGIGCGGAGEDRAVTFFYLVESP